MSRFKSGSEAMCHSGDKSGKNWQEVGGKNPTIRLEVISGIVHNDSKEVYEPEEKVEKSIFQFLLNKSCLSAQRLTHFQNRAVHVYININAIRHLTVQFSLRAISYFQIKIQIALHKMNAHAQIHPDGPLVGSGE